MLIAIDDRGIPTLEIEDAQGEIISYRLTLAPRGLARLALTLDNLANGEQYRVAIYPNGQLECSCPAFRYRKSKDHPRGCKHATAVKHLHALLAALTPETPHEQHHRAAI